MPVSQAEYNMAIDASIRWVRASRYQERVRPAGRRSCWIDLCGFRLRRGKYKEAETEFQKALEFDRDLRSRSHRNLSCTDVAFLTIA